MAAMRTNKKILALAAAALLLSAHAQANDSHVITVNATVLATCKFNSATTTLNMTLDPTLSTTVSQSATILYRCTKGTAPTFSYSSGSTSSATGGNLVRGAESIAYTYTNTPGGNGSGMGAGNDKTLSVTVSVNQANAANVTPGVYTDTISITLTP